MASPTAQAPCPPELLARTAPAKTLVWRLLEQAFRPDPELTVSEWADRHRWLSRGAERGQWRTSRMPHLKDPMDCLSVQSLAQVVVLWFGTQLGKTECGNNWIGYVIDLELGDMIMVVPTSGTGKRSSKTRLAPLLRDTPRIAMKLREASRDSADTLTLKEHPGGFLMIAGANSAAELKMEPVRFAFLDEVDEYPLDLDGQGHPIDLTFRRMDTFGSRKKALITSTGTEQGESAIEDWYGRGNREHRYVPCPHCEHEQILVQKNFRWETRKRQEYACTSCGAISTVKTAPEACPACHEPARNAALREVDTGEVVEVWYECEAKGCRIEERHKTWMFERARWVGEEPRGRVVSFHLPSWYSPIGFKSWVSCFQEYLDAEKDPTGIAMKQWKNTVAAETSHEKALKPEIEPLKMRRDRETYRIGQVPAKALLLTCSIDTQDNRLEVYVYGWGRGDECWLIDHQVIHGDPGKTGPGSVWEEAGKLLDKGYPHASGSTLRIRGAGVDEGGHHTQEARLFALMHNYEQRPVLAMKGQSQPGKTILGVGKLVDIDHRGKKIEGGVKLWPIGVDTAKARLYNRLRLEEPGPDYIHFPLGIPDEYFEQLTAEKIRRTPTRSGFVKTEFVLPAGKRNEALDCWGYAYAAAIAVGVQRAKWDQIEALINPQMRDLFAQPASVKPDASVVHEVSEEAEGVTSTPSAEPDPDPAPKVHTSARRRALRRPPRREGW